jgi:hypothetical protein
MGCLRPILCGLSPSDSLLCDSECMHIFDVYVYHVCVHDTCVYILCTYILCDEGHEPHDVSEREKERARARERERAREAWA